MDDVFGPGGRLERVLPAFEPRAEQAALARAVADALERGEHLLAEAGTGTGKSLAYLVPALASGRRVVVATATKALQEQLVVHDLPAAAAALGRAVGHALLKGRENYLCRHSLDGLALLGGSAGALFRSPEDAAQYEQLAGWLETTATGDRAELPFEPRPSLWAELAVGGDRCLGRRCPARGVCFSEAARARAADAELVVTNHALYLADAAVRARGSDASVLPEHDAVVFDEAHRLEDAAASWFGGRVTLAGLHRLARDVERAARARGASPPARALRELERAGRSLVSALEPRSGRRRLGPDDVGRAVSAAAELGELLGALAEELAGSGEEGDALARRALGALTDVEACLELDPDRVAWAEPGGLAWAPVDVSAALREAVWDTGLTAVLVSATLEAPFLRARLGLDDARELALDSPFDFAAQALVYVPRGLPEPRAPGVYERLADEIVALCELSRGRALVLTTSYRSLDELAGRIERRLPYPVLRQGDAPRERLLERFRAEVETVLVATQTFWQGVDVPGESLSLLVLEKLPFAPPDDPLVQARCERIAAAGGDWFSGYSLPVAVLALRQGFGRLIRTRDDRGVVAILDARIRTRAYGRAFLAALPPCPVVADREAVAAFLAAGQAGGG
ncbi:MAG: ATP-dependent DNA helicase [Thermoleophilia bacterium]|nr:ATP-dependent DNA helicase [Thermoleophilia bacterium]